MDRRQPRVPLAEPFLVGPVREYVNRCIRSNAVASVGPFVEEFEARVAALVGSSHAVACSSGTAALHLAFEVLGLSRDDQVIVPTLTFIASANAVRYTGAHVILADSEANTWGIDGEAVAAYIDELVERSATLPAAVQVVHLFGQPASMDALLKLRRDHQIPIVEDAAEALGAAWKGSDPERQISVGARGDIGCFSFNGNKLITTGGGGMLVTSDAGLAESARHLANQAKTDGGRFSHDRVGFNYRMPNINAAIGLAQLEELPRLLEIKRRIATLYAEGFAGAPISPAAGGADTSPSHWLSAFRLSDEARCSADELVVALEEQGIEARGVWRPLHLQPPYRDVRRIGGKVSEVLSRQGLCLPSSCSLSVEGQERVIEAVLRIID